MITKKLASRQTLIPATPLKDRAQTSTMSRRELNYVVMDEEDGDLDKYDTFFDYEDDLAGLKSSGEQYKEVFNEDPYIVLDDKNHEDIVDSIVMEDIQEHTEDTNKANCIESAKPKGYMDVVGFEFVQCEFVKSDGNQCKRQAPKGKTICSTHKKYIEKNIGQTYVY